MEIKSRIKELIHCRPEELLDHPLQFREHSQTQRAVLKSLVEHVGIATAIVAYRSPAAGGKLVKIDGHMRTSEIQAAWPTLVLDVTDEEATMLLTAMDPLASMANQNKDAYEQAIQDLHLNDELLFKFFNGEFKGQPAEDDDLVNERAEDAEPIADDPTLTAAVQEFGIETGQIWLITSQTQPGQAHRILVGDCRRADRWLDLFPDAPADLVFTDPPYGVSYQDTAIQNDNLTGAELEHFLAEVLVAMRNRVKPTAPWYIWHPSANRREFMWAMDAAGLIEKQYLIWAKPALVLGHADYHHQVEPCFYAHAEGEQIEFFGDRRQTTFWTIGQALFAPGVAKTIHATTIGPHGLILSTAAGQDLYLSTKQPKGRKLRRIRLKDQAACLAPEHSASDLWVVGRDSGGKHPTQKPLALARRAIENSSRRGETVVDPFLGSGCTLFAAEQTGRLCRGFELERTWVAYMLLRARDFGMKFDKTEAR